MKPGPWWRAQNACIDNAKLIMLSDKAHRNWFNLNCLANAHGGVLPELAVIAIKLRVSESRAAAALAELVSKRLFDQRQDGSFVPHDYAEWQFKTDVIDATNAERQRRHRAKAQSEKRAIMAMLDQSRNPLRNGVSHVMAKRPETETDKTSSTEDVETGLSEGKPLLSAEALARATPGRRQ